VKKHYNIPIFIPHLGCPFKCIFCNQNKIASAQGVPVVKDIIATIEQYLSTIAADSQDIEVAFFGGSFTAIEPNLQKKYLQAVQPYIKSGRIGGIRISTRPDFINQSILDFLAYYGVKSIELGVQSFCDEVLKASGRGYSCEDVFKASHHIKSNGLKLGIQLMVGLPSASFKQDIESARQATNLKPDMVRIYPTLVISETPLERLYIEHKYVPLGLEEAVNTCKEMFLLFQQKGIEVIRMGLQPSEELRTPGTVVAGPFHPSFGELVEQDVFKEQAAVAIQKYQGQGSALTDLTLLVNKKDVSKMTGRKKCNLLYLQDIFRLNSVKVAAYPGLTRDTIALASPIEIKPLYILSREEFLAGR